MVTSLFEHERIETTDAKAKELRKLADKMVTLAKRGDLHARRQALSVIRSKKVTRKLFDDIRDRYLSRNGGYTRIIKKGYRAGDAAPVSIIELLAIDTGKRGSKKKITERLGMKKETDKAASPLAEKETKQTVRKPSGSPREAAKAKTSTVKAAPAVEPVAEQVSQVSPGESVPIEQPSEEKKRPEQA
jgi:large subunit ribosomal protein L17